MDELQLTKVQNAFLEAKSINFKKLFVGGEYVFSPNLLNQIKLELQNKDPKVTSIAKLLENDPVNLLRLLSLAHSPLYMRGTLLPSVTSLIQQFGYKRLPVLIEETFSGVPGSAKNLYDFFADKSLGLEQLQKAILTAVLAKKIAAQLKGNQFAQEEAYLLACSMDIFQFALATFNGDLLSTWIFDSAKNKLSMEKNCQKLFLDSETELSIDILRKMSLPAKFLESLANLSIPPWNRKSWTKEEHDRFYIPCCAAYVSNLIVSELMNYDYESKLYTLVTELAIKSSVGYDTLIGFVAELPLELKALEQNLSLQFPDLPGFLLRLAKSEQKTGSPESDITKSDRNKLYKIYFNDIKQSLKNYAATKESRFLCNAVNVTLSLLTKVMKFDRSMLFMHNQSSNTMTTHTSFGRGTDVANEARIRIEVGKNVVSPVVQAYFESKVTFNGDPVFDDDWPFAAFPISFGGEISGVFYADIASKSKANSLSTEEQMAIVNLAELFII